MPAVSYVCGMCTCVWCVCVVCVCGVCKGMWERGGAGRGTCHSWGEVEGGGWERDLP